MTIEELHDHLFEVLSTIDNICKDKRIPYSLAGGTAIGSLREHDFIPWDDDADIKIKWEDYPTFKEAMLEKLPEHLHLVEPQELSPAFFDFAIRIIDDRWLLREETEEDRFYNNYQNRVSVDVFPCCACPGTRIGRKLFIIMDQIYYGMCMRYRYEIEYRKYNFLQKIQVFVLSTIGSLYSGKNPERIFRKWYRFISSYSVSQTGWRYSVAAPFKKIYMKPMPAEWFDGVEYWMIRGRHFPLIGGYHKELTTLFGDYMTPVRDEKTYTKHL
jgi:lipopolysaccharide cholinephosphotransferase